MLAVIALSWSIATCCPLVKQYRAQGFTDAQIEEGARARGVPEWIIVLAKRRCKSS